MSRLGESAGLDVSCDNLFISYSEVIDFARLILFTLQRISHRFSLSCLASVELNSLIFDLLKQSLLICLSECVYRSILGFCAIGVACRDL